MNATHRAPSRRRRGPFAVALAALLIVPLARAQEAPATPAPGPAPFVLPPYLRGIDLDLPAQAAFKDWPPKELEERPYWLPWVGMSFQRAALFNQPIFLLMSVPWNRYGQRMMKEALADPIVLRTLNHDYLTIAVRADRNPDVYARYGTGNWPAISLLLPDGSPMLSQANPKGLALPITAGFSDAKGLLFTLNEGRKYFDKWQSVLHGVSQIYEQRVDLEESKPGAVEAAAVEPVVKWMLGNADAKSGGFGIAPKFALGGLMEWAFLREDRQQPALVPIARNTLTKMAASPLFDAKEGGFHRMAAAPDWGAIQYEKMLESNSDLVRDMVFALRQGDDPALRGALAATARYMTTVLARPGGGFYYAQSADPSTPDGGGYWKAAARDVSKAPQVDKLVLAGPNALAGAALLRASAMLDDPGFRDAGRAAIDLVLERAVQPGRGALHVVEPDPGSGRFLVTQTEVAFGLIDAYEATGEPRYLAAAKDVVDFVRNNMKVADETAYRDHLRTASEFGLIDMPLRPMVDNARLARVLLRLEAQGVMDDGQAQARAVLASCAGDLAVHGTRALEPSLAIDELLSEPLIVTIEGRAADNATAALRRAALNLRHGWVVIRTSEGTAPAAALSWRGVSRRVTDPSSMAGALKELSESAIGTP